MHTFPTANLHDPGEGGPSQAQRGWSAVGAMPGAEQTSGDRGGQAAGSVPATALKAELGWKATASFFVRSVPQSSVSQFSVPLPLIKGQKQKTRPKRANKAQSVHSVRGGQARDQGGARLGRAGLPEAAGAAVGQRQALAFGGSAPPLITDRSCLPLSQGKALSGQQFASSKRSL